jgi:CsoR family transcriptional regulator, copper-sensing transcriptional repressor
MSAEHETNARVVTEAEATAACACGAAPAEVEGRRAVAVDPEIKGKNLRRLKRIEGQIRGLQRMVEEERYCADILTQLSSVQEALRAVGRELMRNHLRHCAATAIRESDEKAEGMYDELVDLMYKHIR